MTYPTNELEDFALSLPITQTARSTASQFAQEQPNPQKAEQVWLNTLAVYAVHDYLQMIGIPTNLSSGDSWNPVVRLCADVADLEVTGIGRLECRTLKASEQTCYVPPEVWSERIGYVVVQINESSFEATVLGFAQTAGVQELPTSQLQPLEDLIDHLHQLTPGQPSSSAPRTKVNLSQWLVNAFETGWQTVESLLNPLEPELGFSFRRGDNAVVTDPEPLGFRVRRAKLIDLGIQFADLPVALIVELQPGAKDKRNVLLQVHPLGNQPYLPPLLQLTVLDEFGLIFLEAQARSADNYIQLQFTGLPGEQFSAKVDLGDTSIMEDFIV